MNEMSDVITETGQSAASLARQKAERITRRDKGAGGLSAEPPKVFGRALTVDHTCDNKLEVARVEEAGGFVEPPPGCARRFGSTRLNPESSRVAARHPFSLS